MRYRYYTCDVFTDTRFGGNPLAVLPEAEGLSAAQMQLIAREFNYSESTFVLPAEKGHDRRVRIFTPPAEVPFAGHPNIGTAFVLASTGAFGPLDEPRTVVFEEDAGLVPITIARGEDGRIRCELEAPQPLAKRRAVDVASLASAAGLEVDDIVTTAHEPLVASVGLPFIIAELRDRDALTRCRLDVAGAEKLLAAGADVPDLLVYVRTADDFDIRARMFSPLDGIPEDPATGSANCVLAALLSDLDPAPDGAYSFRIAQGVEMGRPSVLEARTEKRDGTVVNVWIGGESVMVAEGWIEV